MEIQDLAKNIRSSALRAHCEAVYFADVACGEVPHNQPDRSRKFQVPKAAAAVHSDDMVMTLIKAQLLASWPAVGTSGEKLAELRSLLVRLARPFVVSQPDQWGPGTAVLIVGDADTTEHLKWSSLGSGSVMSVGALAHADATDDQIALLTSTTHMHHESISAATAAVAGMRVAVGVDSSVVVGEMIDAARRGEVAARRLSRELGVAIPGGRSIAEALVAAAGNQQLDELANGDNFTNARYVLACGLRAFLVACRHPGSEVQAAMECSVKTGDPDTTAVVAMGLLQSARPAVVAQQIQSYGLPAFSGLTTSGLAY